MAITLSINKQAHTVDAAADTPLLWVLRDMLGLKGTKYGCGISYCGACTVHVNGRAVRSCKTTVGSVEKMEITTIEGLSDSETHPVQLAWQSVDVPQCGYCQSWQIVSAAAVLCRNTNATDA